MIACRPFSSRVDRLWQAARVANPRCYSQDCILDHNLSLVMKMGREKDGTNSTNRHKKQKAVMTVWRPVSTLAASQEVIEGTSTESMTKESQRIVNVLEKAVESPNLDYSHFISLPLAIHSELVEKLHNFQNSVLGDAASSNEGNLDSDQERVTVKKDSHTSHITLKSYPVKVKSDATESNSGATKTRVSTSSDTGIDKSIFIKPRTFHLTVLMLKLWNEERIAAATEVLQRISSKVHDALDNRPVSIRLKGLECMRGSPAKAFVLYAPVEEIGGGGRLSRACQVIIEAYVEAGLVLEKDARQSLKLHATLMNARYRKWKKGTRRHDSFDARGIFKRYGSEEWGDYPIREAHLSQRFSYDGSGYYRCCASIPFPEAMQTE